MSAFPPAPEDAARIPFSGPRKVIAQRMRASVQQKPQVTLHAQASAAALTARRTEVEGQILAETGLRPSLTHLLSRYVALTLHEYPRINGHVLKTEVICYRGVNLGLAVALEEGLIVPVLRDAEALGLAALVSATTDLTERARSGKLKRHDVMDATFTVTNLGTYGIRQFTPIVNPPEMAILGIGAKHQIPTLVDGQVEERPVIDLSLSFDHAAIDGAPAARFLQLLVARMESARRDELLI